LQYYKVEPILTPLFQTNSFLKINVMKRIKNNKRDKQRKNIINQITEKILYNLDRIAKDLTPP